MEGHRSYTKLLSCLRHEISSCWIASGSTDYEKVYVVEGRLIASRAVDCGHIHDDHPFVDIYRMRGDVAADIKHYADASKLLPPPVSN